MCVRMDWPRSLSCVDASSSSRRNSTVPISRSSPATLAGLLLSFSETLPKDNFLFRQHYSTAGCPIVRQLYSTTLPLCGRCQFLLSRSSPYPIVALPCLPRHPVPTDHSLSPSTWAHNTLRNRMSSR